jgi:hypothetical protein
MICYSIRGPLGGLTPPRPPPQDVLVWGLGVSAYLAGTLSAAHPPLLKCRSHALGPGTRCHPKGVDDMCTELNSNAQGHGQVDEGHCVELDTCGSMREGGKHLAQPWDFEAHTPKLLPNTTWQIHAGVHGSKAATVTVTYEKI